MANDNKTLTARTAAAAANGDWETVDSSEWEPVAAPPDLMGRMQSRAAQADPRTGAGMMERSVLQSRQQMQQPVIDEATRQATQRAKLGAAENRAMRSATPFTNAISAVMAPELSARMMAGSKLGGTAGGKLAERVAPQYKDYGELAGSVVGGVGAGGIPALDRLSLETPDKINLPGGFKLKLREPEPSYAPDFVERDATKLNTPYAGEEPPPPEGPLSQRISEGPTGAQHAAVRGAQADVARRGARQVIPTAESPNQPQGMGQPGSPAQEAGYQPPVAKVPFERPGRAPITPEQIPGPDTPGKGNLLTPAARRGEPGAGQELVRRGRPVLYTPPESYPGTRLQGTLAERMGAGEGPPAGIERRAGPEAGPRAQLINPAQREQYYYLRQQLRDPNLPARDRTIMEQQLADMQSNPFEHEQLPSIQSMKPERRMTLEEATAASESRKAGRKARFEQ